MEEENKSFKDILLKILRFFAKIFKGIFTFFYSIKFLFYIPFLSIGSTIIGFLGVAIVKTLIGIVLPVAWNNGFVETFIYGIIFVAFSLYIFNRRLDEDLAYEWKRPLIMNFLPIIICMLGCVLILLEDFSLESLNNLVNGEIYPPTAVDEIYIGLLPLFAPHLWLGCLTHEFVYSTAICMFINCGVAFAISYYIGTIRDKGF